MSRCPTGWSGSPRPSALSEACPGTFKLASGRGWTRLAQNPRPFGVEKLTGGENRYRIRIGDYRAVYEVRDAVLVVLVVVIAHRREVYR